jgi:hypothetical protein
MTCHECKGRGTVFAGYLADGFRTLAEKACPSCCARLTAIGSDDLGVATDNVRTWDISELRKLSEDELRGWCRRFGQSYFEVDLWLRGPRSMLRHNAVPEALRQDADDQSEEDEKRDE